MKDKPLKLPSKENKLYYSIILAASFGILIAVPVLILMALGYFIDKWLHTTPTFIAIGVVLGFVGSIINVMKLLKTMKL